MSSKDTLFYKEFISKMAHQSGLSYNENKTEFCEIGVDLKIKELKIPGLEGQVKEMVINQIEGALYDLIQEMRVTRQGQIPLGEYLDYVELEHVLQSKS